jgi:hypothetical protein
LATRKDTNGKFSIYCIEGSSFQEGQGLKRSLKFGETHHAIYVDTGIVKLLIGESFSEGKVCETTSDIPSAWHRCICCEIHAECTVDVAVAIATAGEMTFIPANTTWSLHFESVYAKMY